MQKSEGKSQNQSERFTPSPPKGGRSRSFRRLLKKLTGVRLTEFLEWGENVPSKHASGKRNDPYKKKYKAWRKMRMKMAKASRRINRRRL
jgi:hypothetical protein